jgi:hypothetical protein
MQAVYEEINCTIGELFAAISLIENHKFNDDVEYFQKEKIEIETQDGYSLVKGLIKKRAETVTIQTTAGEVKCARKHILFDGNGNEVFADQLVVGDAIKTKTGYARVLGTSLTEEKDVFDLEVDREDHTYATANGVLHHNTSITAALSYFYGRTGYKIITIVPSGDLVTQTKEWYEALQLDVGEYSGDNKDIDHTHVVATWQAIQYNPSIMQDFQVLIWDESHGIKAAVAQKLINESGKHIAFRFGVTGTFPKPEADRLSLVSSIGPILLEIPAAWLIEHGYLAKVQIQPVELNETYVDEEFPDYASEKAFLSKSTARMEMIANLIISQCATNGNTLVLVNSISFGEKLASLIKGAVFLYGESPKDIRKEHYDMFEQNDDIIVIASSGIASTGISIDRVFCLMLVDAGKSFIKAIQSIGRGLRLGHDKDAVHVVDVHSKQKWAKKHYKERLGHYKEASYPILKKETLKVKSE